MGEVVSTTVRVSVSAGARDGAGTGLEAYVHRPAGASGVGRPLAICLHGMNESGLRTAPLARRLAQAGFVAVAPTLRCGGGAAAGPTTSLSPLTQLADVAALRAAAVGWPGVDASRTVLMGRSQGGLIAVLAAAQAPAGVAALALWYPALRAPEHVRTRFGSRAAVPERFTTRVEGVDVVLAGRYALDSWDLDPQAALRRLRAPVLLVHGEQDRTVPLAVSEEAAALLPDARLERVSGAAHGFEGARLESALTATTDFLSWAALGD